MNLHANPEATMALPPTDPRLRVERPGDASAVRAVVEAAFGQPDEADLVDRLRTSGDKIDRLWMVAELNHSVVGHIAYSRITVEPSGDAGIALAPVSVMPDYQGRGIGAQLIEQSLATARELGEPFVILLGHADYYPRFGFTRAGEYGIEAPWEVPPEAWMMLVLDPSRIPAAGMVRYSPAFG